MSDQIVWSILNRNLFFVRNAVKRLEAKTSDKFHIADPVNREIVLECGEPDISGLVKLGRLTGGGHDYGTPFNLVAKHPQSGQQAFRVKRGSTSFTLGGVKVEFRDHQDQLIGTMKKKTFALGLKFSFSGDQKSGSFLLHLKPRGLSREWELLIGDREVARLVSDWKGESADYFKSGKFDYALTFTAEVPANQPIRQILLGFSTAIHRITG